VEEVGVGIYFGGVGCEVEWMKSVECIYGWTIVKAEDVGIVVGSFLTRIDSWLKTMSISHQFITRKRRANW